MSTQPPQFVSVLLAGGKGTRMNVPYPKVLSDIHGTTLIEYVVSTHEKLGAKRVVVVTGYKGELVQETLGDRVAYAHQAEQLGTGHAVQQAEDVLKDWDGIVVIAMGDMPFLTEEMFESLLGSMSEDVTCAVLGVQWPEDREMPAWGRFIRDEEGSLLETVEQKDCTDEQVEIRELNINAYAVRSRDLFEALSQISDDNAQGEFYLTDIIEIFVKAGKKIVPVLTDNVDAVIGINTSDELQEARELHVHKDVGEHE